MTSPIAIILINWNNSQDTIECLASIFQSTYNRYTIIIVDNGSTDGSALEIANFVKQQMQLASRNIQQFSSVKKLADSSDDFHRWDENSTGARVLLLENKENLGFARANNLVMEQLIKAQAIYQHVYMLNNDTVIEPQTISILLKKMRQDNIRVANSLILDYFDRSKIQFAGGKLYPWGKAKFFFKTNNTHSRFSEFTHGCALMIELEVLRQFGLLSNLFFHGEEDFDFSWRLKENSEPVKCYFESKVYHKEGNSVVKYTKNKESKLILSALNRFKNMQLKYSSFVWTVWLIPSSLHYIRLLHRGAGTSLWRSILIVKLVISYTRVHDSIEKTAVPTIISGTH